MTLVSRFEDVLSIDLRSLALVRILTALVLLADLVDRLRYLTVFIGAGSVHPPELLRAHWYGDWAWSLHLLLGGELPVVAALIAVQFVAGVALLFGYRTLVASVVSWVLLASLHNANNLILQGGDYVLRMILFVGMFVPWGNVFSLDHARRGYPEMPARLFSGWSIAFLLQVGLFYLFASLFKIGPEWTIEGSAVYYALSIDQYATALGHYLLNFPDFLTFLTFAILLFQHVALLFLFSPILTVWLRTFAAVSLMLMHLAFALTMHLGMFSWIAIAALVGFIPTEVWDVVLSRIRRHASLRRIVSAVSSGKGALKQSLLASLLGLAYLFYILLWQVNHHVPVSLYLPSGWDIPAKALRIDQYWNLFGPSPFKNDGWYVVRGELASGDELDLFSGGSPLSLERPASIYDTFPNTRWRKYLYELRIPINEPYRPYYAAYLCGSWNQEHTREATLESVELIQMLEMTPPYGAPPTPVRQISLGAWKCDAFVQ